MATFIVKMHDYRNLVIKAEGFRLNTTTNSYEFFEAAEPAPGLGKIVASFPFNGILGVVGSDAEKSDFIFRDDISGPDCGAHDLLDRATDLLMGQTTEEDDPEFWEDYFDFIGAPPIDENEPEPAATNE